MKQLILMPNVANIYDLSLLSVKINNEILKNVTMAGSLKYLSNLAAIQNILINCKVELNFMDKGLCFSCDVC